MIGGCEALTEKEKETLRLLLVGHDAKSMARQLGLSVHTVNDRLRDARRKLSVSSSKEAARLLRRSEAATPESFGAEPFGADVVDHPPDRPNAPPAPRRTGWIGGIIMLIVIAAAALLAPAQTSSSPDPATATTAAGTSASIAARDWLALVDKGDWDASWAATAPSFQSLNTVDAWRAASQKARVPLGRVVSRTLLDEQDTPAPPNGYRTVRFRTDFANKRGAVETVSLDRDGDGWKVVGCYME